MIPFRFFGVFALIAGMTLLFPKNNQGQIPGSIHGNIQVDAQYYLKDSLIGAKEVPEKTRMNGYGDLRWRKGNFSAGARYEAYLPPLLGYDQRFEGSGIPYRFAKYRGEDLEVTVGNSYEQFGSGMIFRTYEEKGLGVDNSLDGINVKYRPTDGITLKGVYGKQRSFWEKSPGIVRGVDGEIFVNQLHDSLKTLRTKLILGGSFVSKYQEDKNQTYNLPENVGAWAGRFNLMRGLFSLKGEYVYKMNDPSADNNFSFKPGQGFYLNSTYSRSGLGLSLGLKSIDNLSFRSDRYAELNNLQVNYVPALTKQHTYNLASTLYPYATQLNGETAVMGELLYHFKKGSLLGGKYGTDLTVNISAVNSPDTTRIEEGADPHRDLYRNNFFQPGDIPYFRDLNVELSKKITSSFKVIYHYFNIGYNMDVIQGLEGKGMVYADIHVLDMTYNINDKHSVRLEAQSLFTDDHKGDWVTGLLEYTVAPHWSISVMDQYNFGNEDPKKRIHYVIGNLAYIKGGNRISVGYGRQRAGIYCVGGVCRNVPASNGFKVSVSSSF